MKAVRAHHFGGSEEVVIDELPEPTLRKGHARVRVVAAAVNPTEWMAREHIYNPRGMDRLPLTLGQDFAGVIEEIAPGSRTRHDVGDAVFGEVWGAFAEQVVVPLKDLARKPDAVSFVDAASIPMSGLTAWGVIVDTARASRRKRILIHGAGGGVGSFAVQLAKVRGAWVAATASAKSIPFLRSIGVDQTIDYERERFEDVLEPVNVVVEHFGGDIQRRSFEVLEKGGMLIDLIGEIDRRAAREAGVKAVDFGMEYEVSVLERIAAMVADKTVRTHVAQVLPFERAREAIDLNQHNQSHGKIVLRIAA